MSRRRLDLESASVRIVAGSVAAAVAGLTAVGVAAGVDASWSDVLLSLAVLVGVHGVAAALVARAAARGVVDDVRFVGRAARAMAEGRRSDPIPVRTLDEMGELTRRFEQLRRTFADGLERERQLRQSVEDADRYKSEFVTSVSHELRTPLNSILGFTDVLLEEIDGPINDAQREDLALIKAAGSHLAALVEDVLDLSAAASGRLTLERVPLEVEPLLREVAAMLRGQADGREIDVRHEVTGDLVVHADPRRLRRILDNLGSNAIEHTERGEIVLTARKAGDAVIFEVRDTGRGIPAEHLARIFGEFVQAPEGPRREVGAGLGLAITRQLVTLHGGEIGVESEEGSGAVFRFTIPAMEGA